MQCFQYFFDTNPEVIQKELFEAHNFGNPMREGLPTMLHFEGGNESKLLALHYASKLSDTIIDCLDMFADRNWNAYVMVADDGFTHVFLGKNEDVPILPDVVLMDTLGSC